MKSSLREVFAGERDQGKSKKAKVSKVQKLDGGLSRVAEP
jgi:hypothetical protein